MLHGLAKVTICAIALACMLTSAAATTLRSGFVGGTLGLTDDGSSDAVDLGFEVDFFGTLYSTIYVNSNGNVTFAQSYGGYSPMPLSNVGQAIIAPFFADVDASNGIGASVTYGAGTVDGRNAFAANWIDVNYYNNSAHPDRLNSFQLVLIERPDTGAGNFDIEFNYDRIVWEAGTASGADAYGLGGTSARAGFTSGLAADTMEFAGSGVNGAFLDGGAHALAETTNVGIAGRRLYEIRRAPVSVDATSAVTASPTVTAVPLPGSAPFLLAAFGLLAWRRSRSKAHLGQVSGLA